MDRLTYGRGPGEGRWSMNSQTKLTVTIAVKVNAACCLYAVAAIIAALLH
jgi:hypothetical protein